jgi:hypothetical protein
MNKYIFFNCSSCGRQGKSVSSRFHAGNEVPHAEGEKPVCFGCQRKENIKIEFENNTYRRGDYSFPRFNDEPQFEQKCASCDTHIFYNYVLNDIITEYNHLCSMCISKLNDV